VATLRPARLQPYLSVVLRTQRGANWRSLGIGPASISLLDRSNPGRCPGENCPNKSGNHPLPPRLAVPLECLTKDREPHKGDPSNAGTGERFAEDGRKDESFERKGHR